MSEFEYLTIGKLVQKLQPTYPDLTVSKVRYLEDEGLLHPLRSTGGYRKYSPKDVARLESILYMQKHRFYPLAVIKEQLERQEREGSKKAVDAVTESVEEVPFVDSPEMVGKLHPIDRMPEICGTPVSFVRSLADAGLIQFKKSPQGRDLVEGRDLALIRACDELRTFGIGPKNLRQYVMAANRESAMFEQALVVYTAKAGGVEADRSEEMLARADEAFNRMLALTNTLRTILIKRLVRNTPSNE
ncbi:MAG: MerR family transcriptional regulator [Atopobiaceae bacterium]|nr:MerR family transcriptional regulator [Atopobiaceae bacterium]MCR4871602.1 MerR family transcriptional regulator [Atopobiaceae bacterium]